MPRSSCATATAGRAVELQQIEAPGVLIAGRVPSSPALLAAASNFAGSGNVSEKRRTLSSAFVEQMAKQGLSLDQGFLPEIAGVGDLLPGHPRGVMDTWPSSRSSLISPTAWARTPAGSRSRAAPGARRTGIHRSHALGAVGLAALFEVTKRYELCAGVKSRACVSPTRLGRGRRAH